jgi:phosphoribosylformylglycinamidine (FGAM) synthase-like enzyme
MGMDMGRDGPGGASSSSARSSDEEDPVLTDRVLK